MLNLNSLAVGVLFQEEVPAKFFPFVFAIPVVGMLMVAVIVGIVFWYKARDKELMYHQDMRMREMEHQRRMKELELEVEKVKARQAAEKVQD
jgi:uncharacterized membrane protein (DUF106 family)